MALQTLDRRTVVAGMGFTVLATIAGCVGDSSSPETSDTPESSASPPGDRGKSTTPPDEGDVVDWDNADGFRTWLTDGVMETDRETNARFEYVATYGEAYAAGERAAVLDLSPEDIDGHLVSGGTIVHFGTFDVASLRERVAASDDHEIVDEYAGFDVIESGRSHLAIGAEAIVVGNGYEPLIAAHEGRRERLEEQDSTFTRLFEKLPPGELIVGQYDSPTGGDVDVEAIGAWAHTMESLDGGDATWVFAFDNEDELTEDVLGELEEIVPSVEGASIDHSSRDGRFARVEGTLPGFR